MDIILSQTCNKPIYEQITAQIKAGILMGALHEGDQLPSIRALANDLGVSVITTKRAYTDLETAGFIRTVQGKGCFVTASNTESVREERLRSIENHLQHALDEASAAGVSPEELREMLDVLAEAR